jgi:hypothetical protein
MLQAEGAARAGQILRTDRRRPAAALRTRIDAMWTPPIGQVGYRIRDAYSETGRETSGERRW